MNWGDIIIGLIGGFILSIIASFASDSIKNRLAQRSLVAKRKRVDQLQADLHRISTFHQDLTLFTLHMIKSQFIIGIYLLPAIMGLIILASDPYLNYVDVTVSRILPIWPVMHENIRSITMSTIALFLLADVFFVFRMVQGHIQDLNAVIKFQSFKESVESRIAELSSNHV